MAKWSISRVSEWIAENNAPCPFCRRSVKSHCDRDRGVGHFAQDGAYQVVDYREPQVLYVTCHDGYKVNLEKLGLPPELVGG